MEDANMKIIEKRKYSPDSWIPILVSIILISILLILPTGYEGAVIYKGMDRTIAKIIETDESKILTTGIIQSGEQSCKVELLGGHI